MFFLFTGRINIESFGVVMFLISYLQGDSDQLVRNVSSLLTKRNESTLFYDIYNLANYEKGNTTVQNDVSSENSQVKIIVKNLSYRYPTTDRYVLKNINISINKGEKIAIVGENGAGKSTFVKILSNLITPSMGCVVYDYIPSHTPYGKNAVFGLISEVPQNPARYMTFTISDNVYLGDTERRRNETDIKESIDFAGLGRYCGDLLLGKEVGGTELSGGEWQKLAIARAHYRDRDLIVLDEPTSNLDPIVETEIFRKYNDLSKDKTVIYVTHRISVAAHARRIVVFSKGHIVEDGTHEQLMKNNSVYADLYKEQYQWYKHR